jgi:hypothetical protein
MRMKKWKESPCQNCLRVANPKACDNKDCCLWRRWFLSRWEQLRKLYGKEGEEHELETGSSGKAAPL